MAAVRPRVPTALSDALDQPVRDNALCRHRSRIATGQDRPTPAIARFRPCRERTGIDHTSPRATPSAADRHETPATSAAPGHNQNLTAERNERGIPNARLSAVVERILEAGRGLYDSPLARRRGRFDPGWPPLGQGLPMGAVTSQLFAAHLYLTALDHRLLRDLRVPGYLRYVDDLFLFADRRADLRAWRSDIGAWLANERHLRLKHPNARIVSCAGHLDGLGFRIRRDGVAPLPAAQRRVVRRMRELLRDPARSVESIDRSLRAMAGHQFLL